MKMKMKMETFGPKDSEKYERLKRVFNRIKDTNRVAFSELDASEITAIGFLEDEKKAYGGAFAEYTMDLLLQSIP